MVPEGLKRSKSMASLTSGCRSPTYSEVMVSEGSMMGAMDAGAADMSTGAWVSTAGADMVVDDDDAVQTVFVFFIDSCCIKGLLSVFVWIMKTLLKNKAKDKQRVKRLLLLFVVVVVAALVVVVVVVAVIVVLL